MVRDAAEVIQVTASETVISVDVAIVSLQSVSYFDHDGEDSYPQADATTVDGSSLNAPKPVATTAQLANYLVNGFWQYAGQSAHHWASHTITYNIEALTVAEKFLAQSALNAWHEVANLTFVQTSGAANITYTHNGSMTAYESDFYNGSGFTTSATINISADWITTDGGANDGKTGIDSYGYQTYLHETGHALGLGHQGPYNGSASYSTGATYANDTWQYSLMSYFSEPNYDGSSYRYVITPQMADIYAVGLMYGAATTRTGDTVYGFNNTAGSIFNFSAYLEAPAFTIYDSGGNDTLDASGYSFAQIIDLHAGQFSSIGGLSRNIGISTTTVIEVGIGGSGNDTLIASDSGSTLKGGGGRDTLTGGGGVDRLIGGASVDTMAGGAGADVFVFATSDSSASTGQHDLISDFTIGVDQFDLTGLDADTSTSGIVDAFRFLATSVFDGVSAALSYFYDTIRGVTVLQGDVNGDRAADFAIDLTGNKTLTSADFTSGSLRPMTPLNLSGTPGTDTLNGDWLGDTLSGLAGTDTLRGFGGADLLDGGTEADLMIGGTGDDTYVVDNASDVVTETTGAAFTAPSGWTIKGTTDFNGDGEIDVVVTNGSSLNQLWLLQSGAVSSTVALPWFNVSWQLKGIGDFNADGKKDILYQAGGEQTSILMNGTTVLYEQEVSGRTVDTLVSLAGSNEGTDTVQSSISYTLTSGVENLTLASGAGSISGTGNAAANTIVGNEGTNVLAGKGGVDTLTGNAGADIFVFATGESGAALGSRDTITDYAVGTDHIDLTAFDADAASAGTQAFRWLSTSAFDGQTGALRASYDSARNVTVVQGDTNGDGAADFAIDLTGNKTLTNADFTTGSLLQALTRTGTPGSDALDGGALGDTLSGLAGTDTLRGFGGADLLDGGTEADLMIGGAGDDTYVVDNAGDVVTETTGAAFTVPSGWTLKGTADFNGDGEIDVVVTNGSSLNQLWLLQGGAVASTVALPYFNVYWQLKGIGDFNADGKKDVLYQSGGEQDAVLMNGTTIVRELEVSGRTVEVLVSLAGSNEGTDTVQASISYTLTSGVENLTLASGAGSISGTGNAAANTIIGNESANVLAGKGGVDTLTGNAGADTFVFATGETGAAVGSRDTITDYTVGTDHIDLTAFDADAASVGIQAFRWLSTSAFDGQAGALRASYDSARGVTVVQGDTNGDLTVDFAIDLTGNKTLTNADFTSGSLLLPLTRTGTPGSDTLDGGALGDTLSGLASTDTLRGFGGADLLDGGTEADIMIGGAGDDIYVVDNTGDVVTETTGAAFTVPSGWTLKGTADFNGDGEIDVVVTNGSSLNQLWLLQSGAVASTVALPWFNVYWQLKGIGDFNADGKKDILYQSGGEQDAVLMNGTTILREQELSGRTVDTLVSLAGSNEGTDTVQSSISYTLTSGVENLTLTSGAGAISGTGNAAANTIVGNESANVLAGKGGVDTLTGNAGADTFVFATGESGAALGSRDTITDYTVGTDHIDLTAFDADAASAGTQAFRWLSTSAFDGQAGVLRASYDSARGITVLQGDTNGDQIADFAIDLTGNKTLTSADFTSGSLLLPLTRTGTPGSDTLDGGALGDTLSGLAGTDTLRGWGGADLLDGGTEADLMIGGAGDDTYVVDNAGDVVTETTGAAFTVPSGWTLKGTADFNGDGEIDVVVTNGGTLNQLWLLQGGAVASTVALPYFNVYWQLKGIGDFNADGKKDVLYQSGGEQTSILMNGTSVLYEQEVSGRTVDALVPLTGSNEGTDTVQTSVSYTLTSGVENLTLAGGAGSISGTGNAAANTIVGNEGANVLAGKGGVDTLTGNAGADTFVFNLPSNGPDIATDFTSGTDLIEIAASEFGYGLTANTTPTLVTVASADLATNGGSNGYFIFDYAGAGIGTLLWDPTGGNGTDAIAVATLQGVSTLLPSDFHIV